MMSHATISMRWKHPCVPLHWSRNPGSVNCRRGSRLLLERFELFEADDVAAEALRGGGAEEAYELRRLLGRAEHPEISVALEHAVELFADELLAEASRLLLHSGVHDARIDARYGDAVRPTFQGQNAGELVEGRFRGAVGGHPRDRMPGGGARDVHDSSPVRRDHAWERLSGAEEGPGHVDVEGASPRIRPGGRDGERDAGCARVVYEDGDVAEFALHPLETGRDRALVGHVQAHG